MTGGGNTGLRLAACALALIAGAALQLQQAALWPAASYAALIGAALIEIIRNSLILLGISTFWQGAFVGFFIVLAVAVDRIRALRETNL